MAPLELGSSELRPCPLRSVSWRYPLPDLKVGNSPPLERPAPFRIGVVVLPSLSGKPNNLAGDYRSERPRLLRILPLILLTLFFLSSCRTVQSPVQVLGENSWNREKDVVDFSINLQSALSANGYLKWTENHLQENQLHSTNPGFPEIPVYEVRYYFFRSRGFRGGYLGTVLWRRDPQNPAHLKHVSTILER